MDRKCLQTNIYVMNILDYKEKKGLVWRYVGKMEEYFMTP